MRGEILRHELALRKQNVEIERLKKLIEDLSSSKKPDSIPEMLLILNGIKEALISVQGNRPVASSDLPQQIIPAPQVTITPEILVEPQFIVPQNQPQAPTAWKFNHSYDARGKLVSTIAQPIP
jgi:hypothetical protein